MKTAGNIRVGPPGGGCVVEATKKWRGLSVWVGQADSLSYNKPVTLGQTPTGRRADPAPSEKGVQPDRDPNRIYLGGHSTGGTLGMLVAECSDRFRAVFSFGPVDAVDSYPPEFLPFNTSSRRELELRAPIRWLHAIKTPVFVFEGARLPGNLDSLKAMARASANPMVRFFPVSGADHFSILAPTTEFIAESVLREDGPVTHLAFNGEELNRLFGN